MNISHLFSRSWSQHYTCNEFAIEAWQEITGENLAVRLNQFLNGGDGFLELKGPESPCIVFMSFQAKGPTHVGLFYCGKVLHLTGRGVQFVHLDVLKTYFNHLRFYQ